MGFGAIPLSILTPEYSGEIFVRLQSHKFLMFGLSLMTQGAMVDQIFKDQLFRGMFYGFLLLICLFSSGIYMTFKKKEVLFIFLIVVGVILSRWPIVWPVLTPVILYLIIQFCMVTLPIKVLFKQQYKWSVYMLPNFCILSILMFLTPSLYGYRLAAVNIGLTLLFWVGASTYALIKGFKNARFSCIGAVSTLVGFGLILASIKVGVDIRVVIYELYICLSIMVLSLCITLFDSGRVVRHKQYQKMVKIFRNKNQAINQLVSYHHIHDLNLNQIERDIKAPLFAISKFLKVLNFLLPDNRISSN